MSDERSCKECGYRFSISEMRQEDYKLKNGKWGVGWHCYPCLGEDFPWVAAKKAEEREEAERVRKAEALEKKELNEISGDWKILYQRELDQALEKVSPKLRGMIDDIDFGGLPSENEAALKGFKSSVELVKRDIDSAFIDLREATFDENKALYADVVEAIFGADEPEIKYYWRVLSNGFAAWSALLVGILVAIGAWEQNAWWQSLGLGLLAQVGYACVLMALFFRAIPEEFNGARELVQRQCSEIEKLFSSMHEAVLENARTELLKTNETALRRSGLDNASDLQLSPVDPIERDRESLKSLTRKLISKDNYLSIISYIMMCRVGEADGDFSPLEEKKISDILNLDTDDFTLGASIRALPKSDRVINKVLLAANPEQEFLEEILSNLCSIAAADSEISDSEIEEIGQIAKEIGISEERVNVLLETAQTELIESGDGSRAAARAVIDNLDFESL